MANTEKAGSSGNEGKPGSSGNNGWFRRQPGAPLINITDSTLIPERDNKSLFSSWRMALGGAIFFLAFLPLYNMAEVQLAVRNFWYSIFPLASGQTDQILLAIQQNTYTNHFMNIMTRLPSGIVITFEVTILAIFFATFIGLFTGLGQISRSKVLNRISTVYVEIVRGIPLVVQIFYIYYSMGQLLKISGIPAAVMAMAICYGAYMGEIFRAGIQAVPRGQMEAALALGLTRSQALRKVILPQTVRIILPAIGNEFIALLKDSSLVSMLALVDIMQAGRSYASRTFSYFETFTMIALVYLVITLFLSRLVGIMEERMRRRGRR